MSKIELNIKMILGLRVFFLVIYLFTCTHATFTKQDCRIFMDFLSWYALQIFIPFVRKKQKLDTPQAGQSTQTHPVGSSIHQRIPANANMGLQVTR